jgi:hypothetical protein
MTDNMDCFTRFTVPSIGLQKYFDYIANSSDEKMLKDENGGELFVRTVKKLEGDLHRSILIDDSHSICTLFEKLGEQSYRITKEQPLEYWLTKLAHS